VTILEVTEKFLKFPQIRYLGLGSICISLLTCTIEISEISLKFLKFPHISDSHLGLGSIGISLLS